VSLRTRLLSALCFVNMGETGNTSGAGGGNGKRFDWMNALYDALIIAGFNFFSTLAGISAAQIITDPVKHLLAAGISAGLGFFTTLAVKRGLRNHVSG